VVVKPKAGCYSKLDVRLKTDAVCRRKMKKECGRKAKGWVLFKTGCKTKDGC